MTALGAVLDEKIAIVTGGGKGIGAAIARRFAWEGAVVNLLEIDSDAARETSSEIESGGGCCQSLACDVSSQSEVEAACSEVATQYGRIDILVNNAGIAHIGTVETTQEADFERIFQVNVKGVYNCLRSVVPYMKSQGSGVILNIASVAATLGLPGRFAYSMSKAAVWNMTLTTARDFVDCGIRCNSVSPARVHTPFVDGYLAASYPGREQEMFEALSKTQPIGRMGEPEEVANLALFLCSEAAAFITGTDFPIDGGFIKLNT